MIVAINRLKVPAGYGEHLEKGFAHAGKLDDQPGFAGFAMLRSENKNEYLVVTRWENQDAFDKWRTSDSFARAHSRTNPESGIESKGIPHGWSLADRKCRDHYCRPSGAVGAGQLPALYLV